MIRYLVLSILAYTGEPGDTFVAGLPADQRSRRIGDSYGFRFLADELPAARGLRRRIREAGFDSVVTGETEWTPADRAQGRLCILPAPVGPDVNERDIIERRPCPGCGTMRYRLAPAPRITIDGRPPTVFTTGSGLVTVVSAAARSTLDNEGLLAGARLVPTVPVAGAEHFLLTSDIDLGQPAGAQYKRRCPECDIPLAGAAYFPIFRRPATDGHVFQQRDRSPGGLLVSEPFAQAVSRLIGGPSEPPLPYAGWFPEDAELAAVPDLDYQGGQ